MSDFIQRLESELLAAGRRTRADQQGGSGARGRGWPITRRVSRATPARRARRRTPIVGTALAWVAAVTAVAVAVVALIALGHKPTRIDHSAAPGSSEIVAKALDPSGGLPWGLRAVRSASGAVCLQVGRLMGGAVGVVGQAGAWADDHGFHPYPARAGVGPVPACAQADRNGNAFMNVSDVAAIANGSGDPVVDGNAHGAAARILRCPQSTSEGRPVVTPPPPCPDGGLRDLEYGLLGPDATSITYIGTDGREHTQPTTSPDGAYLIVRPHTTRECASTSSCLASFGPQLRSGVIIRVTYRGGRACDLPAPNPDGTVRPARCPLVGYQAPPHPHVTRAQLAAPVTVHVISARHYCNSTGANVPGCKAVRLTVAFTAHVATINGSSYYEATINMPRRNYIPGGATGCPGGTQTWQGNGRVGQRIVLRVDFGSHPKDCIGDAIHVTIAYVPDAGVGFGIGSERLWSPGRGAIIVGRASTSLP